MAFHDRLRASVRLREILLASTLMLLARQPALANCSPQAASNVTATCTGATTNQGGGAPGTSTGTSGYGTGAESGITVNVAAGAANTVSGTIIGINIADGTVTNNAGASITGATYGIQTLTGAVNVTNSGSITGTGIDGIHAFSDATVTNNAGASITGWSHGIDATTGAVNVTNSGSITGTIFAATNAAVTNNAGASITNVNGGADGIDAGTGAVNVINSGSITVTGLYGIHAATNATVTNNAGASITAGNTGVFSNGAVNVTNSGSITGTGVDGIYATTNAAVTNNAGASITGGIYGITSNGAVNVTNSGSITGTSLYGIFATTNATVTNNAGASITGATGIDSNGVANVTNSGNITSTGVFGIYAFSNATVTNNAGASITSATYGIFSNGVVNVTNYGRITGPSGAGIYAVTGGSSVFNAGSIIGSTAIQFSGTGNTLTLAPGSVISGNVFGTGSDTFQLGGVGAASFDVSQLGAAAQYRGFGTFNKIGSSTWTLTGTGTFAGPVNVNGGTLEVDGSIASSSGVSVNSGAMLTGTGSVAATQINSGGTLMPGSTANPTGMLTISGNLAFQSGALYLVQVTSSAAASTSVSGTATLAGTVVVDPLTRLTKATTYTILSANALSGTFTSLILANNFATNPTLSYVGGNVELTLGPGLLSPNLPSAANTNQRNLAAAIDNALIGGSNLPGAFNALFNPGGSALTQASGETATGSQQTTFSAMGQFMGIMTDPFMGRGGGVNGSSPAIGYAAASNPTDAFAMFTKAPLASYQPRWSVWASGFGGSQSTSGNAVVGSNDATSRIVGTAVGADYLFAPNTLAGFALAGGGTSFSVNGLGSGRSDLFQAGAYVRHTNGAAYITGALAYGWQDITTNRTVTIAGLDQLRAEFNANAYSGRVEGGYRFVAPLTGGIGLTPYAAGQFTTFDLPGYAEQVVSGANSFALAYGAKDVTDTRSELGLRADKSSAMSNGILTLRGRLAWAHDFNPDRSVAATFQALPGASFVVNGAAQASDSALTTASAEMKWANGWSAAATFEGGFSNVTRSYAGTGVVRYAW